ncbi:MAG TPA: GNAT family N-acetyltransferase [Jatrophihabitans sp.]|nr:GNAT family N-acetyltransferase [Jatrophihabitans sp.]
MLERSRGLPAASLDAIADLEKRVLAADGGRLKLEWGTLRNRSGARVDDLLWWDDGTLLGFLGLYAFGGSQIELAGMVDPAARRRGIGTALLDAALDECRARGERQCLLVVPRSSKAGSELAAKYGGELEHSEHALVLLGDPADGRSDPQLTMRVADVGDADEVARLLQQGFDWLPPNIPEMLSAPVSRERTMLVERAGRAVGTARLSLEDAVGGVYGFTVEPSLQGQGIGRDALRRFCRLLREDGAARVGLEVAVDNERALGLYTSIGFTPVTTEDYYRLSL